MIHALPFEDMAAYAVLARLDWADHLEAELVRGAAVTGPAIWADWRAMRPAWVACHVFARGAARVPFAVGCIVNTGQAGVAEAALLARDHARNRRALAELALTLRANLPDWAAERGIHRIEARCWANHPTAATFLAAIGFHLEAPLPGFGADGRQTFLQFAWLGIGQAHPDTSEQKEPANVHPETERQEVADRGDR